LRVLLVLVSCLRPAALLAAVALVLPLAANAADAPRGTGIHYVYLIRHGIYDRDSTADEITGNGLNAMGHLQAQKAGQRLAGLPIHPASLVSSTLRRARETADDMGVAMKMTPVRDSLIAECTPTSERADVMKGEKPEDVAACDAQLAAAWAKYMTPTPEGDRHDVLVCHGNVIRWFVSHALGADPRWLRMEIGNGSMTILSVRPDGTPRLVVFSDVAHLPVAEQTWSGKGAGWGSAPKK